MSHLVAVAYDDRDTAERVRGILFQAQKEHLVSLEDAVVVTRNANGKVKLHQAVSPAGAGATGGALWGGLIGLLFLAPLLGMAIGAASGAAVGSAADYGVDDQFLKRLGAELPEGGAALIVLVRSSTPDKLLPRIQEHGGTVIQSSLDEEAEERLRAALGEHAPAG
jgi:uncharacterized membrane protein